MLKQALAIAIRAGPRDAGGESGAGPLWDDAWFGELHVAPALGTSTGGGEVYSHSAGGGARTRRTFALRQEVREPEDEGDASVGGGMVRPVPWREQTEHPMGVAAPDRSLREDHGRRLR